MQQLLPNKAAGAMRIERFSQTLNAKNRGSGTFC
jgi:hypothetical protein